MNKSHKLAAVGTTLLLAAASARAQIADNIYFGVDGGGAFQQDVAIINNSGFNTSPPGGSLHFNNGYRVGLDVGYDFCESFAVELDGGIIQNTISQVGQYQLSTYAANAKLEEIPLLVNFIYKFPLKSSFKPFIGIGVGGMEGIFNSSNIPLSQFGVANPSYNATDYTFACQAQVGFKYSLGKHMELGAVYKFVGTTEHDWNANNLSLQTDGTMTQSIEATFNWRF